MLSEYIGTDSVLTIDRKFPACTNQFLEPFKGKFDCNLKKGVELKFIISDRVSNKKTSPILKLADPDDAKEITRIYHKLYEGTYPYKEMEDEEAVVTMIEDPHYKWVLFKDVYNETLGCFTFELDFKEKRGYARGLMLKSEYQGSIDLLKATVGSYIGMYSTYENTIFRWYGENRTAHAKSQYAFSIGGMRPIAFFPNKDVFFGKVESDIMHIAYDIRALHDYRNTSIPRIIPEAVNSYYYSNLRYALGSVEITTSLLHLDSNKIKSLSRKISKEINRDMYGYIDITLRIEKSGSYFKFLYTPTVQNFEKTEYKVQNLEELYVFIHEFKKYMKVFNVRYCEVFVSAYKPNHQKLFLDAGLSPRGYVPSWAYDKVENHFDDYIVFNCYKGYIDKDIKLIQEGKELLKYIDLNQDF